MSNVLYIVLKFLLSLHSFLYKVITILAVKIENGLHPKHRLTNYHDFFLNNINDGDSVLDVGCGNGFLAYDLSKKAAKVVGIDISRYNIKYAKDRFQRNNIMFITADVTNYKFENRFDVIVLSNILEHIEDRQLFLNSIREIGNRYLIRVPCIDRDWITLYKKELGLEWRLDSGHFVEYTFDLFAQELEEANFQIVSHQIVFGEIWAAVKLGK